MHLERFVAQEGSAVIAEDSPGQDEGGERGRVHLKAVDLGVHELENGAERESQPARERVDACAHGGLRISISKT